ncbi:uncharacterized protein LOC116266919 isoform X3 [Nymphaea colorata]|uniref:uncharacterized protein LOC116266919 isoform X3 n=1 Tax=Nymphaea colorata TaxID=210225 RepID=UPI00129DF26B|nr:uncharacterized protein LOC116266919 isoform X3 [Nymphaea colorata]
MKRKRGLKTKHKKSSVIENKAPFSIVAAKEDESVADDTCVNSEGALNSRSESGSPFLGAGEISSDRHHGLEDIKEKAPERPGYGRVRVKLKSSKSIGLIQEAVQNSPTVSLHGDILPNERLEDGTNPLSESETVSGKSSKKFGSIKIKSSRSSGTSSASFPDKHRVADQTNLREICKDPRYNERELTAALGVIKKIMKMDAAQPFNTPVNPVALGIPDYFDIIDTPMDFGTICAELEFGKKYMNSEDVYKDVQYIWGNCYKYNNKGDYILDLMKRVKKNFAKYWTAAGLYSPKKSNDVRQGDNPKANISEEAYGRRSDVLDLPVTSSAASHSLQESPTGSNLHETESTPVEVGALTSQVKSASSKQKGRRHHGINKHKADCLCAVCIARRRRHERDVNLLMLENQIETNDANQLHEFKPELQESDGFENTCDEEMAVDQSLENKLNSDPPVDDVVNLKHVQQFEEYSCPDENGGINNSSVIAAGINPKESNGDPTEDVVQVKHIRELQMEKLEEFVLQDQKDDTMNRPKRRKNDLMGEDHEEGDYLQKVSLAKDDSLSPEDILNLPYSGVLHMCGTLFSVDARSVWSGPHSLNYRKVPIRDSAIHSAIAMFMEINERQ